MDERAGLEHLPLEAQDRILALRAEVERLVALIKGMLPYVGHADDCASYRPGRMAPCDCGVAAARATIKAHEEGR